jgi:hypothetical protein
MELYTSEILEWKSSLIKETEYTPDTLEFVITFNNGEQYLYKGFSEETYHAFCNAESQGKFFLTEIRNKYNKKTENQDKENGRYALDLKPETQEANAA